MRRASTLEAIEESTYEVMVTADDPYTLNDALLMSGYNHLMMEPRKLGLGFQEIWASMHGRSGAESLGILAHVSGIIMNAGVNPLTMEHAAALRESAEHEPFLPIPQHADEQ